MSKKYLKKKAVRARYGDVSDSTIERMVKDQRLPPPKYFGGSPIPLWDEAELDKNDRAATLRSKAKASVA